MGERKGKQLDKHRETQIKRHGKQEEQKEEIIRVGVATDSCMIRKGSMRKTVYMIIILGICVVSNVYAYEEEEIAVNKEGTRAVFRSFEWYVNPSTGERSQYSIVFYDVEKMQMIKRVPIPRSTVWSIQYSPAGDSVVYVGRRLEKINNEWVGYGMMRVYSPEGEEIRVMETTTQWYRSVRYSEDGKSLYVLGGEKRGNYIFVMDVETGVMKRKKEITVPRDSFFH